jgi:FkbM family methyltransferase
MVKAGGGLSRLRDDVYRWVWIKTPRRVRSAAKRIPYLDRAAESRPRGEQLLRTPLLPGIVRNLYLPEAFHWISFEYRGPELLRWVAAHVSPGAVSLDIGGHLGIYTLLLAEMAGPSGRALVFEPLPDNATRIRKTVAANGLSERVDVIEAAVDDTDGGEVTLFVGSSSTSDRVSMYADPLRPRAFQVPTVSIDAALIVQA